MSSIKCKAAIAWEENKPLSIEDIEVAPPKAHEVRIKIHYTGVCHTDAFTLSGIDPTGEFPVILGHEGGGVVESVGEGVTNVKVGDHVIPLYTPECRECRNCKSGKTNLCSAVRATQGKGVMPDGTSRFTCKGKPILHYMGCSTFSQYTVVTDVSVVAVDKSVGLDKICLLGCGITTGVGAAQNTAKVQEGDTVAVFGAGCVGLSVVQGASINKASKIVVVDLNDKKKQWAFDFGATHFVNPTKLDKGTDLVEYLTELSDGGFDYTFDATGSITAMNQALLAAHRNYGVSVVIGVAGKGEVVSARPLQLILGRTWTGSAFGGVKGRTQMPDYVSKYVNGKLKVDEYISERTDLAHINDAFDKMTSGDCLRCVVDMA